MFRFYTGSKWRPTTYSHIVFCLLEDGFATSLEQAKQYLSIHSWGSVSHSPMRPGKEKATFFPSHFQAAKTHLLNCPSLSVLRTNKTADLIPFPVIPGALKAGLLGQSEKVSSCRSPRKEKHDLPLSHHSWGSGNMPPGTAPMGTKHESEMFHQTAEISLPILPSFLLLGLSSTAS